MSPLSRFSGLTPWSAPSPPDRTVVRLRSRGDGCDECTGPSRPQPGRTPNRRCIWRRSHRTTESLRTVTPDDRRDTGRSVRRKGSGVPVWRCRSSGSPGVLSERNLYVPAAPPPSAPAGSSGVVGAQQHSELGDPAVEISVNHDSVGAEARPIVTGRPRRDGPDGRRQRTTAVAGNQSAARSVPTHPPDDSTVWPNSYPDSGTTERIRSGKRGDARWFE